MSITTLDAVPAPRTPEQAQARALVREGYCPLCEAGPFGVLAQHVRQAHSMNSFELREYLGVFKNTTICDPAHSSSLARASRSRWYEDGRGEKVHAAPKGPRELSSAGKDRCRMQVRLLEPGSPPREAIVKGAKARAAQMKAEAAVAHAAWLARWNEGAALKEIAQEFGVWPATVSRVLKGLGALEGVEARRRGGRVKVVTR